jgi:hypothetical protein
MKKEADSSIAELEFPIIELEISENDRSAEKRKDDARKPLYIKRV